MKIHRFIDNFDLSKKELEISDDIAYQIIKVLKFEVGEKIELGDGKGTVGFGKVKSIGKGTVLVGIERIEKVEENKKTTLFCAVLKKENFELVVQKATECGVSKIVPIITSRTIKTGLNLGRLQKIAKEASEQSGRGTVPEILEPISFEKSLKIVDKNNLNILFDISGELFYKKHCAGWRAEHSNLPAGKYARFLEDNSPQNLFIGPEGGWTEEEIKKVYPSSGVARDADFKIYSLGNLTLRAETAAIVATYLSTN
ncbi:16S rRNA (uracil(1498)-N(3))-methyltransferase [Patescibacteria group bacterium]|nr:16S rRNA (uracil(1498)-N(3))-methyltransferase [Patescibacteria group bacterium]